MSYIDKIKSKCYELELAGIKPSLLIAGNNAIQEIYDYTGWNKLSSKFVELSVNGNNLLIVKSDDENMVDVYGKDCYDQKGGQS